MVSFVILLVARTARIACADRQTDRQNDKPSTVTLAAHARRGLMKSTKVQTLGGIWRMVYWNIWIENTLHAYVLGEHTSMKNELYIVLGSAHGGRRWSDPTST